MKTGGNPFSWQFRTGRKHLRRLFFVRLDGLACAVADDEYRCCSHRGPGLRAEKFRRPPHDKILSKTYGARAIPWRAVREGVDFFSCSLLLPPIPPRSKCVISRCSFYCVRATPARRRELHSGEVCTASLLCCAVLQVDMHTCEEREGFRT